MSMLYDELRTLSHEELYREGRRLYDIMRKRKRRLQEKRDQEPGVYSLKALNSIEDSGIPTISKGDTRNVLLSKVNTLSYQHRMKTSTLRGAKADMELMKKNLAGVDPTRTRSRMVKADRDKYDEITNLMNSGTIDATTFWEAFETYQEATRYKMLDSQQELTDFRNTLSISGNEGHLDYRTALTDGTASSLNQAITVYVTDEYERNQKANTNYYTDEEIGGFT